MNDIASMLPHSRKDAKFDSKTKLYELNELAEMYNCNNVMFFEARKERISMCGSARFLTDLQSSSTSRTVRDRQGGTWSEC